MLEESEAAVTSDAVNDSRLLFGSARKHELPLVLGSHSVHTSRQALARGEALIREAHAELRCGGRM